MEKTITISSEIENMAIAENIVDSLTLDYDINPDLYGNILVSLHEAINNAIIHGNKLNKSKTVSIYYSYIDTVLRFIVTDQGNGFNYDYLTDPTAPENIENPTGRGIFLIRNLSDGVTFRKNGCEIDFFFQL